MRKAATVLLMAAICLVALTIAYLWTAKRTVAADSRRSRNTAGVLENPRFELFEYRYRPITVWRFRLEGHHAAQWEYVYGATEFKDIRRVRWHEDGNCVLVETSVIYDAGETLPVLATFDFEKGSFTTTLARKTEAEVTSAFSNCRH